MSKVSSFIDNFIRYKGESSIFSHTIGWIKSSKRFKILILRDSANFKFVNYYRVYSRILNIRSDFRKSEYYLNKSLNNKCAIMTVFE